MDKKASKDGGWYLTMILSAGFVPRMLKLPAIGECQRSADTKPSNAGNLPKAEDGEAARSSMRRVSCCWHNAYHSVLFRCPS